MVWLQAAASNCCRLRARLRYKAQPTFLRDLKWQRRLGIKLLTLYVKREELVTLHSGYTVRKVLNMI